MKRINDSGEIDFAKLIGQSVPILIGILLIGLCFQALNTIGLILGCIAVSFGIFYIIFKHTNLKSTDDIERIKAMEKYHKIKYHIIPEQRLYIKEDEECEISIKTKTKG